MFVLCLFVLLISTSRSIQFSVTIIIYATYINYIIYATPTWPVNRAMQTKETKRMRDDNGALTSTFILVGINTNITTKYHQHNMTYAYILIKTHLGE